MIRLLCLLVGLVGVSSCVFHELPKSLNASVGDARVPVSDSRIRGMGRFETLDNGSIRFAYPGVSLKLRFFGKRLYVKASSSEGKSYMEVIVDGKVRKFLVPQLEGDILLFQGEAEGEHELELVHSSETWHGRVTVSSFLVDRGAILSQSVRSREKVLVIGDSITCGEAIDRPSHLKTCGPKVNRWWSPRKSFGMRLAKELDADVQLVCMGGKGLIRMEWSSG